MAAAIEEISNNADTQCKSLKDTSGDHTIYRNGSNSLD